ncbi:MAG TPA: methyltransferase domain-containing protein [Methylotenera sp.]
MSIVTDSSLALFKDSIAKAWDSLYKCDMAGAMSHAKMAATIGPDLPETFHILGLLASRDGRSDIALPLLEKALAIEATERRCRDIAEAYLVAGEAELALTNLLHALREFGSSAELCGLLAAVYVALDQYGTAAAYAKEAIALKPHLMAWEGSLSFCHLIQGDYTNGFEIYTGRSQNLAAGSRCPVLHFTKPGELWLKNEQGPGDTLFYARFAKPLADAGWRIHLQTDKKTKVLLRDTGVFASVKEAITPPLNAIWLNMGDLPLAAIQTGAIETPPPLALMADQSRIRKVREKLSQIGPAPYIAVTWRAGARGIKQRAGLRKYDKVASPKELGKLLSNINATVISIQRVPDDQEQSEFATALGRDFINFSYYNDNLQEMLALLSVVDEYVTVPNTNVHLRESLNLSAQVLVNRPYQDWRWLVEGSASPWYPNSTIYRQGVNQDWGSTFTDIGKVLYEKFGSLNSNSAQSDISRSQIVQNEVDHLLQKGWSAVNTGDIPVAIQAAQSVIKISAATSPTQENAEALHLLGWAALRDSKYDLAINILQRAAEISQIDGRIIGDYVRALSAGKRHDGAIKFASDAISNSAVKNISSIYFSRAAAFLQLNKLEDAIADYEACIRINPNRLDAQEYCGMARLKLGDTVRGFRDYTARNVAKRDELINDWCCPRLTKEHSGLHVLIKRDMGLGDELTFLRYLSWLTEAGIKVDYWTGKKLVPILERTGYFNQVFSDADPAPDRTQYDISFIVNELPVAVELLGVPPVAPPLPLIPKPELVDKWRKWLKSIGNGPYIGINWRAGVASEDIARSRGKLTKAIDADAFALTLSAVNATWVSLQRNIVLDELQSFEKTLNAPIHDAAALTDDLEDLLALVSLLDENIGVSNTNMHLRAGLGLGSKVLVQTPGGDWRWGYQGNQSLWFIESKVYRQNISEDWSAALNELQSDLVAAYGNKADGDHVATYQSHLNISSKRLIWLTAGVIKNEGGNKTSTLASARYRVLAPALELEKAGWNSEFVNEAYAQAMGGWGSNVPQKGDTVIISKVFTDFSVKLAQDAKNRGATVITDFCDNFLAHPQRGPLQHALLAIADYVTASTPAMAEAIQATGKNVDAIIADPVDFSKGAIKFGPNKVLQLLWFGHVVNIDTLIKWLPQLTEYAQQQPLALNIVTTLTNDISDIQKFIPEGLQVEYTPWSEAATVEALANCDLVVIPTLDNDIKKAKSSNRLLETLWSGRFVVAGNLPSYASFANSAWVGDDLIEGVRWAVANPEEVMSRIKLGQQHVAQHYSKEIIGQLWANAVLSDPTESLSQQKCMVIISYYDERDIDDLLALIASIEAYEPGHLIEITIVVNQREQRLIDVSSSKYKTNILYRQNQGMNIGAWDYGWRQFKDVDSFIFLQDECRIIRDGWVHDYLKTLESPKVGLVGESINQRWNRSWSDLQGDSASNNSVNTEIKARAEAYLSFMQRNTISPGKDAKHLRSLIWAFKRSTLDTINGFPTGANYEECIASEIAVSKKVESLGLEITQIDPQQPFSRIVHSEWSAHKKIQALNFKADFAYGQKFSIAQAQYKVKPRYDLFQLIDCQPRRICEIGCADGSNLIELPKSLGYAIDKSDLCGVDIVADDSCENYQNFQFIHQTAEEFVDKYQGASFDLIILSDVVEHLYNPWVFMQKMKGMVSAQGRVVISVPNVQNLQYVNGVVSGSFNYANTGLFDVTHIRFFSVETLTQLLEVNGYRVVTQSFRPDSALQKLRAHVDAQFNKSDKATITFGNVSIEVTRSQMDRYFSQQILISCAPI